VITVQLQADGPITEMDESLLEKREGVIDNEHERTSWVEYWIPGSTDRAVHRSVHVSLKQGLILNPEQGQIGG
jgi:hypothetical protein